MLIIIIMVKLTRSHYPACVSYCMHYVITSLNGAVFVLSVLLFDKYNSYIATKNALYIATSDRRNWSLYPALHMHTYTGYNKLHLHFLPDVAHLQGVSETVVCCLDYSHLQCSLHEL